MRLALRFATTPEDKDAVYRLRYELFVEEQGLFQDEADHQKRWIKDQYDTHGRILLAEEDGRIVGTARANWGRDAPFSAQSRADYELGRFRGVVDERNMMLVTRLIVRKEHRGGMLTTRLFRALYAFAVNNGIELAVARCEPHLVSHYKKLGFRPYGKLYNHETNGRLVPMAAIIGPQKVGVLALSNPIARAIAGSNHARVARFFQGIATLTTVPGQHLRL